jgi:subtilisin-like proprotein convertase family protein
MNQRYQNLKNKSFLCLVVLLLNLCPTTIFSQIVVSTESGTNYGGLSFIAAANPAVPCAVTFVIQNTNAQPITLTKIDYLCRADQPGNAYKLWYSATSLSNTPTITAPAWTLITSGSGITVDADAITTVLENFTFTIPANTQYRFALETSNGIGYTGVTAGNPTPNVFTNSGVSLKVGNSLIGGFNVGYGGGFPNPINVPRFFTGRIHACTAASPSVPATAPVLSPDTAICGSSAVTLRVTGGSLNNAVNWKWYTGSCGGTAVGTGTSITVTPTANTTYYVRGEGGCASAPGSCAQVTVAVKPIPGTPVVNPISPICLGSSQALVINPIAVTPASVTVNSGPLSIAIPDNVSTGANTTLTVAGVPAGATITRIDVLFNLTHTWAGDMIMNLRAPNGQILNLNKYLGATGAEGTDYVNTVISSAGTADLATGVAPFTGIFKPDAINAPLGTAPVQNPAGFVSNAASFANLYSIPNGVWTLAMADGGPGDLGVLTNWSITISYTTNATSYPAVWSPGSTLFTDAAATIPYDGVTPTFQVYAKPAVTTTYSAISFNDGCPSPAAGLIDVVVNNPFSITSNPQNQTICEFGTAQFTVVAGGTTPSYQWIADRGTDTINLVNNANYSGVNNDTLTITNAPAAWNGYKYSCIVTSVVPCTTFDTTSAAALTVNPTPVVGLSVAPYTRLLPGLTTTLSVTSTPAAATYNWIKDGANYAPATGGTYNATIDNQGSYRVAVIDVNGCTNTTNAIVLSDSASSRLFIFPNPNKGNFVVSYYSVTNNVLPRVLTIYDAKGALVLNRTYEIGKPYDRMEVDFSMMQRGLYIVNLLDNSGQRIASGKVVVQ